MAAPTLDDLASELNMSATPDPDSPDGKALQRRLDAAVEYVERRTRPLSAKTVTVRCIANNRYLTLPAKYITAVNSLTDPVGRNVDLSVGSAVNLEAGIIALPYLYPGIWSPWVPGYWQAEIVVGDDNPPADLVQAALYIAAHLWKSKRGGFAGNQPPVADATSPGYAIPNQAAELINDYLTMTFA